MRTFILLSLFFVSKAFAQESLLLEFGQGEMISNKSTSSFTLTSWNIYKGGMDGLYSDLAKIIQDSDFTLIQEFLLNDEQQKQIKKYSQYHWGFAKSFQDAGEWTGVATVSKWQPKKTTALKSPSGQPLVDTPKMTLVSQFVLPNGQELWLVNLHALNFDITHAAFMEQIEFIISKIKHHQGPLIFAGDFNTWSDTRLEFLLKKTQGLDLIHAELENPMGLFSATLDHIFYRGFKNVNYRVMSEIESSDHNPFRIEFEL